VDEMCLFNNNATILSNYETVRSQIFI